MCNSLNEQISFLTELISSPNCQSVFFANPKPTDEDLKSDVYEFQETTKQHIAEQAARTSQFLKEVSKEDPNSSPFGEIKEIFNLHIDPHRRIEDIITIIEGEHLNQEELQSLIIQEVFLTSTLRKYAKSLMSKLMVIKKILYKQSESGKDVYDQILKLYSRNTKKHNDHKNYINNDIKNDIINTAEEEEFFFDSENESQINSSANDSSNDNTDQEYSFEKLIRKVQNLTDILNYAQKESGLPISKIPESFQRLKFYEHQIQDLERIHVQDRALLIKQSETLSELKAQVTTSIRDDNSREWYQWAKDLYFALTNINYDDLNRHSLTELRVAIEEAALTSVGNNSLPKTVPNNQEATNYNYKYISKKKQKEQLNLKENKKTHPKTKDKDKDNLFDNLQKYNNKHAKTEIYKDADWDSDDENDFRKVVAHAISAVRKSENKKSRK